MIRSVEEIIEKMTDQINRSGLPYSSWYVGIASEPKQRLFAEHKVAENGTWLHVNAGSNEAARNILNHLVKKLQTEGGGGSDEPAMTHVYAYAITSTTVE
ncbi:MAG TPA: hypothetical protein PKA80_14445 [Ignavibacteriaceae bacterium]|nr:hypothetical protein [Ignavibacteriaceae bacterium]